MATVRKKHVLSLNSKMEVIDAKEKENLSVMQVLKKFNIGKTQFYDIMKKKDEIKEDWLKGNVEMRRKLRKTGNEDVNEIVWEWFVDARSRNLPVSGPIVQAQAKQIAERLGKEDFHASNGWLESFRKRHAIKFKAICGEAADVDAETVNNWEEKLVKIIEGYELKDIANGDETGLFFRALPTKTLCLKAERCTGGKQSKERLTVFLCSFLTGEKEKPLVIGKAAKPRCFKNLDLKNLTVEWRSNKKAWMTAKIMEEWLVAFNSRMRRQKRNVLLFLDNASCHPHIELSNVKLAWFPPNTTSVTQPMDQGIIRSVKINYRSLMMQSLLANMKTASNSSELTKSISVLDAIVWLAKAWQKVTSETTRLCFTKANFPGEINLGENPCNVEIESLQTMLDEGDIKIKAIDFVTVDDKLATETPLDIEKAVLCREVADNESSDEEEKTTDAEDLVIQSYPEAMQSLRNLNEFAAFKGDAELLGFLNNARMTVENRIASTPLMQKTILDYFKK